jgi:hypothetical protein
MSGKAHVQSDHVAPQGALAFALKLFRICINVTLVQQFEYTSRFSQRYFCAGDCISFTVQFSSICAAFCFIFARAGQ